MDKNLTPLILDFLEWLASAPRPYSEVMEAWRTSCPRLTVWEDATEQGLVARKRTDGSEMFVEVTPLGRKYLAQSARKPSASKEARRKEFLVESKLDQ